MAVLGSTRMYILPSFLARYEYTSFSPPQIFRQFDFLEVKMCDKAYLFVYLRLEKKTR